MKIHCPYCKTMTPWEHNPWRPFCSERCKLLDIGNWVDGKYSVPSAEPLDETDLPDKPDDSE